MTKRNRTARRFVAGFWVLALWIPGPVDGETWTSASGSTIEAEFVDLRDGQVVLRTGNGKEMAIAPEKLDPSSLERVKTYLAERPKAGEGAASDRIGVFKELSFPTHDVVLRVPNGQMLIYPKTNGVRIGDMIEVNLQGRYADCDGLRRSRTPVSMIEPPQWEQDHVLYRLLMQDDVRADLYYRIEPTSFTMGYRIEEPPGAIHTDDYRIQIQIGAILTYDAITETFAGPQFSQPIPTARLPEALQGRRVVIEPRDGKKRTFPYSEGVRAFPGDSETIRVEGAYGPVALEARAPKKKGMMWARIYDGGLPCGGYSIAYRKENLSSDADKAGESVILVLQESP